GSAPDRPAPARRAARLPESGAGSGSRSHPPCWWWSRRRRSWQRTSGSRSRWWCRRSPGRSPSARRRARVSRRSPARRRCPSHRASASRDWRTAPDSRGSRSPSGSRGGSSVLSARRDRRNCKPAHSFRGLLHRRGVVRLGKFLAQFAQQAEFGLEVDVMRQFQMLDKAGRLHIVGMRHHEFLILRRRQHLLTKLSRAKRTIDQGHRHGLALALPESKSIAAGKTRRLRRRALELRDHLAFGQRDRAERHFKTDILGHEFDLDLAEPDFAGKGMVAAIAALRRVAEREQKTLIG